MAFRARFDSVCCVCGDNIYRGEFYTWPRTIEPGAPKKYLHERCKDKQAPAPSMPAPVLEAVTSYGGGAAAALVGEPVQAAPSAGGQSLSALLDVIAAELAARVGEQVKGKVDAAELAEFKSGLVKDVSDLCAASINKLDDKFTEVCGIVSADCNSLKTAVDLLEKKIQESNTVTVDLLDNGKPLAKIQSAHKLMPLLARCVATRANVYLYDATGGGKSHAVKQLADSLGLRYVAQSFNRQTPSYFLTGYMDAVGNFVQSIFYDYFKNGGVYCGEEMDDGSADLLVTLNVALAQGVMTFPNGETVVKHKDFCFVGCGNTAGRGASPRYPERKPFDAAYANRFVFIQWTYDKALEKKIAVAINPKWGAKVANWVALARAQAEALALRVELTPRTTFTLCQLIQFGEFTREQVVTAIMAGLDQVSIDKILASCPLPEFVEGAAVPAEPVEVLE